jgi:hypothetical protein
MVNDGDQHFLVRGEDFLNVYHSNIAWNVKDRSDLNLYIDCDFEYIYE